MQIKDLRKIEFWVATALYLLVIFFMVINIDRESNSGMFYNSRISAFREAGIDFSYLPNYILPKLFNSTALYLVFLVLNFYLIPAIIRQQFLTFNIILLFSILCFYGLVLSVGSTWSQAYLLVEGDSPNAAYIHLFVKGYSYAIYMIIIITSYVLTKTYVPRLLNYIEKKYQFPAVLKECTIATVVWLFVLFLFTTQIQQDGFAIVWGFVVPLGILQYGYGSYRMIPQLKQMEIGFWGYLWRTILLIALIGAFVSTLAVVFYHDGDTWPVLFAINLAVHSLFTASFTWMIYNYRLKNKSEISQLKTELVKSGANLSFLQSQINPHFLFNALNTLYGTALQEKAERTGEGIQKLGDMMRFMLHENVQDKISLTRDVDYLENYIALQKLRTSRSADIIIDTQIDEQLNNFEIAPMLLIPFVENAFKHGISLQQPSHIKIVLQTKGNTLYFDVSNSIYIKPDNDPEKLKSGIGLINVKQRLALLYPNKHELIIRESAKEFFIHLTIEL